MYGVNYNGSTSLCEQLFDQNDCYNYDADHDLLAIAKFHVYS